MSLVAYCASDESDVSETEEIQVSNDHNKSKPKDQISDDEEYEAVSSSFTDTASKLFSDQASDIIPSVNLQQGLPPPQKREEITVEETELEEEVRQKPSELANAPKPPKKTKQPVKITIPSLNEVEDDDDDIGSKKKPVASSSGRSGLFALLPPPIHSAKKEINRPLIPHSLGKKPTPATPVIQAPSVSSSTQGKPAKSSKSSDLPVKAVTARSALTSYDEDEGAGDDASSSSSNFFSLDKEVDSVSSTNNISELAGARIESSYSTEKEDVMLPERALSNDSPLSFNSARKYSSWSSASSSSSYLGGLRPYEQHQDATSSHSSVSQPNLVQPCVQYNLADADESEVSSFDHTPSEALQQVMTDKEFQRLHGKRKRGVEEEISFVDAKVDDYVDPSELSKHITEEAEYTPQANKNDMPTSQQKRKKQITYLAFQAKEKEMELKNTWSQNRLTKRQTQAKYGF